MKESITRQIVTVIDLNTRFGEKRSDAGTLVGLKEEEKIKKP